MAHQTTLAECPIGLFMSGDELCLKTEYGTNEGRIDAYIVSTGEFFWGSAPQTIENQRKETVLPVEIVTLQTRPVAFRLPDIDGWIILQSEEAAQIEAEHRSVSYQGLYVREFAAPVGLATLIKTEG